MTITILNKLIELLGNDLYIKMYTDNTITFLYKDKVYKAFETGLVERKEGHCLTSNDFTNYLTKEIKKVL